VGEKNGIEHGGENWSKNKKKREGRIGRGNGPGYQSTHPWVVRRGGEGKERRE